MNNYNISKYKTVDCEGIAEIIEKKSRFIAAVRPVSTEEEAREFIESLKKKHWNATHNVFAYSVGLKNEITRFSDDGEPSGTAGMPVLSVITGNELKNTAIVVTRYFGGTLLGTGGLVRAYGRAASEGLLAAGAVERVFMEEVSFELDYTAYGKLDYYIQTHGIIVKDTEFLERVIITALAEPSDIELLCERAVEITGGKGITNKIAAHFVSIKQDKTGTDKWEICD